jgi:hypothetical protein
MNRCRKCLLQRVDVVGYQKDENIWGAPGCLGYPSALLLLSIANGIGSYVVGGGNTEKHFSLKRSLILWTSS